MSILRSSKFIRNILSEVKSNAYGRLKVNNSLVLRSLTITLPRCASTDVRKFKTQPPSVENAIQRLDREVRRVGRISTKELLEVFNYIKNTGRATPTQSLFVIRCCGNLVPEETLESRSKLVNEIWNSFEKLGVSLDISHYNALLSVYLENEFVFSPSDILSKLESKGIEPNRVTYQRLIASCCLKGDIEGATQILQTMKDKQLPINIAIFNSLIIGHSQANDIESAVGILSVMKNAGLEPNSDTYTALLNGYAKFGDIESINRTIEECESKDITLMDRDLLEVAFHLIINDHSEHVDQVFAHLKKVDGYNQDAKNVGLRLISRDHSSGALDVLRTMIRPQVDDQLQNGNFLIKQAVKAGWPLDKLIAFCEEMKNDGLNPYSLQVAAESSMVKGNMEMSLQLLSALSQDETIHQQYYWPILVHYGKDKNFTGVINTLKQLLNTAKQPVTGETLKDYVMPYVKGEGGIESLRQAGIPLATSASAAVGHLMSVNKTEEAKKIALKYRSNYNSIVNHRLLIQAYSQTNDLPFLLTMVQVFAESEEEPEAPGQILLSIIRKTKIDAEKIINGYLESGIPLSSAHVEVIKDLLDQDLTPELSETLTKLASPDFRKDSSSKRPQLNRLPTVNRRGPSEKDENSILYAIKAVEAKGESAAGLKRQLLLHYCHTKEIEKALSLKEELEKDGLELLPGLLVLLMDLYCHHEKLEEALEYYNRTKAVEGSRVDASKVVKLAALLCKNERYKDALDMINCHPQSEEEPSDSGYSHLSTCWKLLNTCAENGQVELLTELFDSLVKNNYIEPTNILLGPFIKVHILRGDLDSALKEFEKCCIKYRSTPWKNELTCKLIEKEDAASLQKVADLSTQIHGEVNSLFDLVMSFVECKKVKQARKILETPGLRTKTQRISASCNRYYSEGRIDNLTTLLDVTKDFNHINRSEIFDFLMMSYSKIDEVDKALALWTQIQEEDTHVSDLFLVTLGNLLKKHDHPVPFEIPIDESNVVSPILVNSPVSSNVRQLRRSCYAGDVDEVIQLKSQIKDEDLKKGDISRILSLLVKNGRVGEASKMLIALLAKGIRPDISSLGFVVNSIAKIGDVDSIAAIGSYINQDIKKMISFANRRSHCMVEAGRAKELVKELTRNMIDAKSPKEIEEVADAFPRGGIFSVFANAPELLPQLEEMAAIYKEKGCIDPINMLWAHYTITGDKENADKAWSQLNNSERIMFMPILKHARKHLDVNIARDLLNKCKSINLQPIALGLIYSCILDIDLSQDKLEDCEKTLEEALNVCELEDIRLVILRRLKSNLELAGKKFKYELPAKKTQNRQESKDSNSSSSSDSDSEETQTKSQQRA